MIAPGDATALPELVRRFRRASGLSQESLAQRAGVSVRQVSDLERGLRTAPHRATLTRLADALELDASDRAVLLSAPAVASASEPAALATSPPGLNRELTSFVGRTIELHTVGTLLARHPLVTLAGPGGAGKTRLALHIAREVAAGDGPIAAEQVVLVELDAITDPALVERALAVAIGAAEEPRRPLIETLTHALATRHMLLVLDNCEHLVSMCAELIDALLRRCPELHVLATSRAPLAVPGEAVFRVPPLRLPPDDSLAACRASEAVELFAQRAQAARTEFALDDTNAPSVARICQLVEGLPIAIELAAARVASLSVPDIATRLTMDLGFLAGGPRTVAPRQQTLAAAIAWSYELLAEDERQLFELVAVFAGSFSLRRAESLDLSTESTLRRLERLVAQSMVQLEPLADGSVRYRVLAPLRQFARERLAQRGELQMARQRHAETMRRLIEEAAKQFEGPRQVDAFREFDLDWPNVQAALDWAEEAADAHLALLLAAPLWMYWSRPDRRGEGRARLARVLAMPGCDAYPGLRARLIGCLGGLAVLQADLAAGDELLDEALTLGRTLGDAELECNVVRMQGLVRMFRDEPDDADRMLHSALAVARRAKLSVFESLLLGDLANLSIGRADWRLAEEQLRESIQIARSVGNRWAEGMAVNNLGDVLRARGDTAGAAAMYEAALSTFQALNDGKAPHGMLHNLAYVALARGDVRGAATQFLDSAAGYERTSRDQRGVAECVVGLAAVALRLRRGDLAARLLGAADAALEALGTSITPTNRGDYERTRAELGRTLVTERAVAAEMDGRQLNLEQALQLARTLLEHSDAGTQHSVAGLTPREVQIAEMLARGLRNREIADHLVITERTAANHVQRVLDKLGVHSRAQVAARAVELGLAPALDDARPR